MGATADRALEELEQRARALREAAADSPRVTFEEALVLDAVAKRYEDMIERHQ